MVVEDDDAVADAIGDGLRQYAVDTARARRAGDLLRDHANVDLVVLDLGLPDMDGLDALRKLRKISGVPVIILTARGDDRSIVRGLRLGADDYLVKPVGLSVLRARIDAVSRRALPAPAAASIGDVIRAGNVQIDQYARKVMVDGSSVALTPTEFGVLTALARRAGQAVSREEVMDEVWGDAYLAVSRSLDVHIAAVRAKIGRPGLIATIRGFGFRLED
jgi:DNA-binding response OmpR family regulator